MTDKPDVLQVIAPRVDLRRAGKEHIGLCPFHSEKTPSFAVSESKQVFYCHGCHEGGDVIAFIQKFDGLSFTEALRALGIDCERKPIARVSPNHQASILLADWLNQQFLLVGARCREVSRYIALADELGDKALSRSLTREWEILADIHEDLQNPDLAGELWGNRGSVELITAGVELEPPEPFPALTADYLKRLEDAVSC